MRTRWVLHRRRAAIWTACIIVLGTPSCSRTWYRKNADWDAYFLTQSREIDAQWDIPDRTVEPDYRSRMADPDCPDCAARPPDDLGAAHWMTDLQGRPLKYYECIDVASSIESEAWLEYLPRRSDGSVDIRRETAVALGLLHSRTYQTQVEQVYLSALGLAENRFEFVLQWLGGSGIEYSARGADLGSPSGSWANALRASKQFAAGGQIAANLLNSFTWTGGGGGTSAASSLALVLTQPLLRGAFRHVRLEGLTQTERDFLYVVRDFAHFRRVFYLGITRSYLGLLSQIQAVRNQRSNVESLELNLREHQELQARKMVSQIQVDQVFQQYLSGRIDLFSSEQGLASAIDAFKVELGFPPQIDVTLDETILNAFELTAPELEKAQDGIQVLFQELVQYLPPEVVPLEKTRELTKRLQEFSRTMEALLPLIEQELARWQKKLNEGPPPSASAETKLDLNQQAELAEQITATLLELKQELAADAAGRDRWPEEVEAMTEQARWDWLSTQIGKRLNEQIGTLYVTQTQIRLFLIDIAEFTLAQDAAVDLAYSNRLDLMNQQAMVTDAFRKVEVAADALQSDLNLEADATLQTEPGHDNPLAFDASAAQYRVGLQFDGPLNRFSEQNTYRATQIGYQQSRRQFMEAKDRVAVLIRGQIRDLRVSELNFQVARQQLITAIRQVEEAQLNLRITTEPNSNATRDLLQALQGLLGSKNNLISSWIEYESGRIQLFVELEILQLDESGVWLNENENPGIADGDSILDSGQDSDKSADPSGRDETQPDPALDSDNAVRQPIDGTPTSNPVLRLGDEDVERPALFLQQTK